MVDVNTVLGPIDAEEMGFTFCQQSHFAFPITVFSCTLEATTIHYIAQRILFYKDIT